jgi:ubiquinone biosynthesis accessory factor UbiJ
MSFALLQTALLLPIELALNQVLSLDAASKQRLAKLEGRTLGIQVQQPSLALYIKVYGSKLHLSSMHEGDATTTIIGAASSLLALLLKREELSSLQGKGVELRGDIGFAQALQKLLLNLDIDWEFHLSRFIGDIPTQALHDGIEKTQRYASRTAQRVGEDVQNFLKEESGLLPSNAELEAFYAQVQDLVLRVDRSEARLSSLVEK